MQTEIFGLINFACRANIVSLNFRKIDLDIPIPDARGGVVDVILYGAQVNLHHRVKPGMHRSDRTFVCTAVARMNSKLYFIIIFYTSE